VRPRARVAERAWRGRFGGLSIGRETGRKGGPSQAGSGDVADRQVHRRQVGVEIDDSRMSDLAADLRLNLNRLEAESQDCNVLNIIGTLRRCLGRIKGRTQLRGAANGEERKKMQRGSVALCVAVALAVASSAFAQTKESKEIRMPREPKAAAEPKSIGLDLPRGARLEPGAPHGGTGAKITIQCGPNIQGGSVTCN
jgi:hypothetical protein